MNLFEHSPDCVPLMPCAACEIVAWLRGKLRPEDFAELVERTKTLNVMPKRTYRRRHAKSEQAQASAK